MSCAFPRWSRILRSPGALIGFPVRQHIPDQDDSIPEEDLKDEAIFVPAAIDDGEMADLIGPGEIPPQCGEVALFRPPGDAQPPLQRFLRVGMLPPEFA
jgi:hypothetical protein